MGVVVCDLMPGGIFLECLWKPGSRAYSAHWADVDGKGALAIVLVRQSTLCGTWLVSGSDACPNKRGDWYRRPSALLRA